MSVLLEDENGMEEQILKATNDLRHFVIIESKEEQEQISNVEFQFLTLNYSIRQEDVSFDDNFFHIDFANEAQMIFLIDAMEMNLTSTSLFYQQKTMHFSSMNGGGVYIPAEYTIGGYDVTVRRQCYDTSTLGALKDGDGYEPAVFTTYRIRR